MLLGHVSVAVAQHVDFGNDVLDHSEVKVLLLLYAVIRQVF